MSDNLADILLVEDNPHEVELALRALQSAGAGHRVQVVRDGVQALDFLFCRGEHACRQLNPKPHVVLLDLKLPKVDGLEVLRQVKSDPQTQHVPVVMLSSSSEESDIATSYSLGANSYVVKPIEYSEYAEAIRHLSVYWLSYNERAYD